MTSLHDAIIYIDDKVLEIFERLNYIQEKISMLEAKIEENEKQDFTLFWCVIIGFIIVLILLYYDAIIT